MHKVTLTIVALITLSQVFLTSSSDALCSTKLETMDTFAAKILIVTDSSLRPFTSVDDFDTRYCRQFSNWLKQGMLPYKACLPPFQGSLFSVVIRNIKKIYREYCLDGERRLTAYNHLRCITESTRSQLLRVTSAVYNAVNAASLRDNVDEIIPSFCCGIHFALAYTEEKLSEICYDISGPGTGEFIGKIFNTTASDAIDLLCGQYSSTASCAHKVPQISKQVMGAMHAHKVNKGTPIIPLMKVLSKLDFN